MDLHNYLESMSSMVGKLGRNHEGPYHCFEDFVLKEGREYRPAPLPKTYRRRPIGQCYANSQLLAFQRKLIYVEGYALDARIKMMPFMHAWCVEPGSDKVIDPTWGLGLSYIGVAFNPAYVRRRHRHNMKLKDAGRDYSLSLIDDYPGGWPVLTGSHCDWRETHAQSAHRQVR
jgi:hypothetical protein